MVPLEVWKLGKRPWRESRKMFQVGWWAASERPRIKRGRRKETGVRRTLSWGQMARVVVEGGREWEGAENPSVPPQVTGGEGSRRSDRAEKDPR